MNTNNKLHINTISLFPDIFKSLDYGVIGRAIRDRTVVINNYNLRDFSENGKVDDRPYGGGPGMVLGIEPIYNAVQEIRKNFEGEKAKVIYVSPRGKVFNQKIAYEYSRCLEPMILISGRYKGIDHRCYSFIDDEISLGDYIISGGELAISVILDSIIRLIPGVLDNSESINDDTFTRELLECPIYTKPEYFNGKKVPEVLTSGNHNEIKKWRLSESLKITKTNRYDLYKQYKNINRN